MSGVTRDDLKTILLFGIHIAKVDEEFAPFEKDILHRFADAMKLTEAERTQLLETKISLVDGLQRLSGQEARALLLKTLCAVSKSDGKTHPAEMSFIHKVIDKLGDQVFVLPEAEWGSYEQEVFDAIGQVP
jgi:tellurite resistance protein